MTRNKEEGTQVTIPFTEKRGDCEFRCWQYGRPTSGSTILIKGNVTHFMNICRQTGVATTFHAGSTENSVLLASCVVLFFNELWDYSKRHPPPSVQIPVPSGQDSVQRPCPICRICLPNTSPPLKNRTCPFMWWCLLQKQILLLKLWKMTWDGINYQAGQCQ